MFLFTFYIRVQNFNNLEAIAKKVLYKRDGPFNPLVPDSIYFLRYFLLDRGSMVNDS